MNAGSRLFATIVFGSILLFYLMGQEGSSVTIRSSPFTILRMEKVRLEAELEKTIEELESANMQLSRTRDGINFLNELMTHDMSNFSHAAMGFLEQIMNNKSLDEKTRIRFLEGVERNIRKSTDLIHGIQSLSDVINTVGTDQPSIDLSKAIKDTVEAIREVDVKKRVSISTSGLELEAYVKIGSAIEVILNNIISNAVKFSRNLEEIPISITLEEFPEDNNFWLISVTDHCGGISDKKKDKVFKKFTRFHKNVQGSGLGLYIVQKLVSALNGRIWVTDFVKDGEIVGCKFQFTLPKV